MPTPRRSAMPKTASRWPSRSPSMPTGSRPPKRSAPSAMAASRRSAVPGERRMPLCGKATIWMVARPRKRSRTFRISWRLPGPSWLSMSTWLRMCSVPLATHLAHQVGAGLGLGHRPRRAHRAFGLDAVGDAIAGRPVGHPGQAEQGLVEMDVAVDQRRQDQRAAEIERIAIAVGCARGGEGGRRCALPGRRCAVGCRPAGWRWRTARRYFVSHLARFLAGLGDGGAGGHGHQAAVVGDGDEAEALADHLGGIARRAVVDAGELAALLGGGQQLVVDRQNLRLLAVELGHQAERQAEVAGADIDAADARHVEDGVDIVDRLLGLDHRDDQHFVIGRRLVGRRLAVGAGADRAVAALALGRIERIGDQRLGFGGVVHHRADHAPGAAVQHLADDAGLVPRHAHQRRDRDACPSPGSMRPSNGSPARRAACRR